ncbi:MAG: hypothetical protein IJS92_07490 [Paludibacteraceae bacterium]|nr:hypothetical protein [Paludibacteraceae bacterium]
MKKILIMLLAAVFGLSLTGCNSDSKSDATVKVKVVDLLGLPQSGETVYMFKAQKWDQGESFREVTFKDKSAVTDNNGVATFELREAFDLEIIDSQTTLYFATFGNDGKTIKGQTAVTVKKGETKEATIRQ